MPLAADSAILLAILPMVAVVGLVVFLFHREAQAREKLAGIWKTWAARNGYRFIPAKGGVLKQDSARVQGERNGATFEVAEHMIRHGKHQVRYTRVVVHGDGPAPDVLIVSNSAGKRAKRFFGAKYEPSGDAAFDQRYLIEGSDWREIADDGVRTGLLEVADRLRRIEWNVAGTTSTFQWYGRAFATDVLDAAIALAASPWRPRKRG